MTNLADVVDSVVDLLDDAGRTGWDLGDKLVSEYFAQVVVLGRDQ